MKTILLSLLATVSFWPGFGQSFIFNVPNTHFQLEYGAGVDTRIGINFSGSDPFPVYLSADVPPGIVAVFQPDTVYHNDTLVLSMMVKDSTLTGSYDFTIRAKDSVHEVLKTIHLLVQNNGSNMFPEYPALTYRDIAFGYLNTVHPEISSVYGEFSTFDWNGFWQYPPLIVVSNYVFLSNNWRCNVLWHIMIPPYNWKKVFVYNEQEDVCLGVNIDTDGNCTEIPCEKHYYFYQDSVALDADNIPRQSIEVQIYPNPSSSYTTLRFSNPGNRKHTLRVYALPSDLVAEITDLCGEEVRIPTNKWKPGIYIFKLENLEGEAGHGKFIKL